MFVNHILELLTTQNFSSVVYFCELRCQQFITNECNIWQFIYFLLTEKNLQDNEYSY